jgi:hypothetical protein
MPNRNSPSSMDPKSMEGTDALLISLANRCGGDLRQLLFVFFSFLNRRTDFYLVPHEDDQKEGKARMGFQEGDAEKVLLASFRQFPLRKIPSEIQSKAAEPKDESPSAPYDDSDTSSPPRESLLPKKSDAGPLIENMRGVRLTDQGLQIPVGNGGSTHRYKWTQTIDETSVLIGIPNTIRAKDLSVTIKASFIAVKTKLALPHQHEPHTFVQGNLTQSIVPDESTWTLEGGVLILLLTKRVKSFWKTVVEGDDEIDASLVDSRRRIDEYDASTQTQLRKIIFDQNQVRRGGASSDEILGTVQVDPSSISMPPGVEYIDQKLLDKNTNYSNK